MGDAIAHLVRVSTPLRILPHLISPNRHVTRAMSLYVGAAVHEPRYLALGKRISEFPGEQTQVGWGRLKFMFQRSVPVALIEVRIIYLQGEQSGLVPKGHHQGGSAAHPLERATSMHAQLREGARAEVG